MKNNVTIKAIKEHASFLKNNCNNNRECWKRLYKWLEQFDNILFEDNDIPRIRTRNGVYYSVMSNNVVGAFYFLGI